MKTEKEICGRYDICSAPLCPENMTDDVWFPSEEICQRRNDAFIRAQRKIALRDADKEKYFTFDMLNKNCIIGKNIKGIDPDGPDEDQAIKRWLLKHPSKRILTDKERDQRRKLFIVNIRQSQSTGKDVA